MAKILVVDDHAASRQFLVALLGYSGHEVIEAADGIAAIEAVRTARPRLVITDILMPRMDGFQFARHLKADPGIADTPIIFYSATYREREAHTLARACGVNTVLSKPADPQVILDAVNAVLGLPQASAAQAPILPAEDKKDALQWIRERVDRSISELLAIRDVVQATPAAATAGGADIAARFSESLGNVQRLNARLVEILKTAFEARTDRGPSDVVRQFFDAACGLVPAPYAAVGIIDENTRELTCTMTKGFDGHIVAGAGADLWGLLKDATARRWNEAPAAAGLPASHPVAPRFVAAAITAKDRHFGWIYFAGDETTPRFGTDDENTIVTLGRVLALRYDDALMYDLIQSHAARLQIESSDRAQALERLRMRDRALEAITQGIVITDINAREPTVIYTNAAFAKMTGYAINEIVGKNWSSVFPNLPPAVSERLALAHAKKRPIQFEIQMRRMDGRQFLNQILQSPIFDDAGDVTGYVSVHEDITAQRRREEMLHESQKMETVGQLTGGIAHDFNNLLAVIKSNGEDIRDHLRSTPDLGEQADMILQAVTRGADLVRQLLAFSRKQELRPEAVSVAGVIEPFIKLVRRTMRENIEVRVEIAPALPAVYLDSGMLENALLNLAVNARDAMPQGGTLTIEARLGNLDQPAYALNPGAPPGSYVVIAVSDTGEGMSEQTIEHAFEPFFTTKEVGKGTGLGLSMVYGFVKQSGGYAKIYSELGIGTTVKLFLPPSAGEAAVTGGGAGDAVPAIRGSGSILLVEDDELVRMSVERKLERLGYAVTTATNAADAVKILESRQDFQLVFSDVIMPGAMTGADLAVEVQARWPAIKVLLTSGYTAAAALGRIKIPAGVELLSKPYSNADLARTISEAMR